MTTPPPRMFRGHFNEVLNPHLPIEWDDPAKTEMSAPRYFQIPESSDAPVTEDKPRVFSWTRTSEPAQPKPAGYRYFTIPIQEESE
jgi:hypothetical protein